MDPMALMGSPGDIAVMFAVMMLPVFAHAVYLVGKRENPRLMTGLMLAIALGWMFAVTLLRIGALREMPAEWFLLFVGPVTVLMALGLWRLAGLALPDRPMALRLPVTALFVGFGLVVAVGHAVLPPAGGL
jgi:hypothetical protein